MVLLTNLLRAVKKLRRKGNFMDSLNVYVRGGTGGAGLPKYGGRGGQGGCVYCVGTPSVNLYHIKQMYPDGCIQANHGADSIKNKILGQPGEDVMLEIPTGVTVIHEKKVLGEINEVGQKMILARGGPGGEQKNHWLGIEGQAYTLQLELRLIADVGLLGFPNAGKSTLLRAVSRSKPKVASYPFTTIRPSIGVMEYPDLRQITMADLPGLIEGAHRNIGMGHRFLRHVERTKLMVMLVDIRGFSLSVRHPHRTALENILLLNKELELYNPILLSKPTILVVNKMDTPNAERKYEELIDMLDNLEAYRDKVPAEMWPSELIPLQNRISISAKDSLNVQQLKDRIRIQLDLVTDEEKDSQEPQKEEWNSNVLSDRLKEKGPTLT